MRLCNIFALTLTITVALSFVHAAPKPGLIKNVAHGIEDTVRGAAKTVGHTLGVDKLLNKQVQKVAKKEVKKMLHKLDIDISDKNIDALFDAVIKVLSQLSDEQLTDLTNLAKAVLKFLKEHNISISLEDIKKFVDVLVKVVSNITTAVKTEYPKAVQQVSNIVSGITTESPKADQQVE